MEKTTTSKATTQEVNCNTVITKGDETENTVTDGTKKKVDTTNKGIE